VFWTTVISPMVVGLFAHYFIDGKAANVSEMIQPFFLVLFFTIWLFFICIEINKTESPRTFLRIYTKH